MAGPVERFVAGLPQAPSALEAFQQGVDRSRQRRRQELDEQSVRQQQELRSLQIEAEQARQAEFAAGAEVREAERKAQLQELNTREVKNLLDLGNVRGAVELGKKTGLVDPNADLAKEEIDGIPTWVLREPGQPPEILRQEERKEARAFKRQLKRDELAAIDRAAQAEVQAEVKKELAAIKGEEKQKVKEEKPLTTRKVTNADVERVFGTIDRLSTAEGVDFESELSDDRKVEAAQIIAAEVAAREALSKRAGKAVQVDEMEQDVAAIMQDFVTQEREGIFGFTPGVEALEFDVAGFRAALKAVRANKDFIDQVRAANPELDGVSDWQLYQALQKQAPQQLK